MYVWHMVYLKNSEKESHKTILMIKNVNTMEVWVSLYF